MVIDPELRKSIVELGMVRSIDFFDPARVDVVVSLTTAGCPIRSHFQDAVTNAVAGLDGVREVNVGFDVLAPTRSRGSRPSSGVRRSPRARWRRSRT